MLACTIRLLWSTWRRNDRARSRNVRKFEARERGRT